MNNNQEQILAQSSFDSKACNKIALALYCLFFLIGLLMGLAYIEFLEDKVFLIGLIMALFGGGLTHIVLYLSSRNNQITLTNYKITGVYNRHLSLNIPIDSISSVSKGWYGSLCITCAGNRYNISFVSNRDTFCSKLNELLNNRTQQTMRRDTVVVQTSKYDELEKLKQLLDKGIITQEEFDAKKKQLLDL